MNAPREFPLGFAAPDRRDGPHRTLPTLPLPPSRASGAHHRRASIQRTAAVRAFRSSSGLRPTSWKSTGTSIRRPGAGRANSAPATS